MHDPKMVAAIRAAMNDARMTGEDLPTAVLDALAAAGRLVPDGWVAVPREPTREMLRAADNAMPPPHEEDPDDPRFVLYATWRAQWTAMLAAAPRPEDQA